MPEDPFANFRTGSTERRFDDRVVWRKIFGHAFDSMAHVHEEVKCVPDFLSAKPRSMNLGQSMRATGNDVGADHVTDFMIRIQRTIALIYVERTRKHRLLEICEINFDTRDAAEREVTECCTRRK